MPLGIPRGRCLAWTSGSWFCGYVPTECSFVHGGYRTCIGARLQCMFARCPRPAPAGPRNTAPGANPGLRPQNETEPRRSDRAMRRAPMHHAPGPRHRRLPSRQSVFPSPATPSPDRRLIEPATTWPPDRASPQTERARPHQTHRHAREAPRTCTSSLVLRPDSAVSARWAGRCRSA
jgi:hypothetical protein